MSRRARETLTGGQRSVQAGQTAAGLQQVGLLGDLSKQRVSLLAVRQTERMDSGKKLVHMDSILTEIILTNCTSVCSQKIPAAVFKILNTLN